MNSNEKIDNMRFGFTGIAGFNKWHYIEGNDYDVWESRVRAEQHMNGQEVKNVIGSNYIQGRQQLEWEFGDLQVFPNPSEGTITIIFPNEVIGNYEILNSLGSVIHRSAIPIDKKTMLTFEKGIYLINCSGKTKKIIIL